MTHSNLSHHGTSKRPVPAQVTAFLVAHRDTARAVARKYNIPVCVILAQSALESRWGTQVKGNAFFGIKGKAPDGSTIEFATHEVANGKSVAVVDSFRAYANYGEAADDYARMLTTNPNFASAIAFRKDPLKFAAALKRYATDPSYTQKIKQIIVSYDLLKYEDK
jgi:flagellar protein FlgJ